MVARVKVPTKKRRPQPGRRVYDRSAPKKVGTLIEEGPQQSLVKWDHSGLTVCVSNAWLRHIRVQQSDT